MTPEILLGVIKAMAGVMAVMLGIMGFLLVREFSQKDKLRTDLEALAGRVVTSMEALNKAVAELALAIEEIRMWSTDRFVHQTDYDRGMKEIKATIRSNKEDMRTELENHAKNCPAKLR